MNIPIKNLVYSSSILRNLYFIYLLVRGKAYCFKTSQRVLFEGWGMLSVNMPPWQDAADINSQNFLRCDENIAILVGQNKLNLTQFDRDAVLHELERLRWRHYLVYSSTVLAIKGSKSQNFTAIELGVCDGLTAAYVSFAINEHVGNNGRIFLVDAWQAMRESGLVGAELASVGAYGYLSLQNTILNLENFSTDKVYIQGYVPEILTHPEIPQNIDWLHIDLNASQPTIAALNFFWERLSSGGLILLDDYGFVGYEDTKIAVDSWVNENNLTLFATPTGQAIIFKH